jgi:hypothetical protein
MGEFATIKYRDVPVYGGRVALSSKPTVGLTRGGQIVFSKRACQALGRETTLLVVRFDEEKRLLSFIGVTELPKGLDAEDCFKLRRPVRGNATWQIYISGGNLMRWLDYDYKGSGTQCLDVAVNDEQRSVMFVLPQGCLPPRVPRSATPKRARSAAPKRTPAAEARRPVQRNDPLLDHIDAQFL